MAERIRRAVAASEFVVETSTDPIRATISIGVAAFPSDGNKANELIHRADVAVYDAKLRGATGCGREQRAVSAPDRAADASGCDARGRAPTAGREHSRGSPNEEEDAQQRVVSVQRVFTNGKVSEYPKTDCFRRRVPLRKRVLRRPTRRVEQIPAGNG